MKYSTLGIVIHDPVISYGKSSWPCDRLKRIGRLKPELLVGWKGGPQTYSLFAALSRVMGRNTCKFHHYVINHQCKMSLHTCKDVCKTILNYLSIGKADISILIQQFVMKFTPTRWMLFIMRARRTGQGPVELPEENGTIFSDHTGPTKGNGSYHFLFVFGISFISSKEK